jgi:CRISPR-associated protein Cst1
MKNINKLVGDQIKKVEKYFSDSSEYRTLVEFQESIKQIDNIQNVSLLNQYINSYYSIMVLPFINEKLTLNYAKAIILGPYFGQVSILQPVFNSKTTQEHIDRIHEDFILPALKEFECYQLYQTTTDYKEILVYLENNLEYAPFKEWFKNIKKMKSIDDIHTFFRESVLPCTIVEGMFSTQSYEEMIFSPLGLSKSKAVNFSWDFENDTPMPISSIARLFFFMAPLGFAFYSRKIGNQESNETLQFSGLVLSQRGLLDNIIDNNNYKSLRANSVSFSEAVVGLLNETIDKANRKSAAYVFIELYSNYQAKKTLLDYYHMPDYLTNYLKKYGKTISLLQHTDLKDSFLRDVMKGLDPKQVIFKYLREAVKYQSHAEGAYFAIRERKRIIEARKDEERMKKYDWLIKEARDEGIKLAKSLSDSRSPQSGKEENYQAPGRKKIESIAYRLINAAKAGNKSAFMDTIFRIYLSSKSGAPIPDFFVVEKGLDFETIASAFIAGLLGQEEKKVNKEDQTQAEEVGK